MKESIVKDFVKRTAGKFFTVTFIKKDGSERKMNCRTSVKKHLAGGVRKAPSKAIVVYDVKSKGYRCFYPESVISARCGVERI